MTEINIDLSQTQNLTEDELFSEAKRRHYNSECYRPSFLIRIHNLAVKINVSDEAKIQRQDLTINICRGKTYSLGQSAKNFNQFPHQRIKMYEWAEDDNFINLFWNSHNPFVSYQHCAFGRDEEEDKVYIRDLDSEHGTFINGSQLDPENYHELKDGDIVSLGISHLDSKCSLDKEIFWVFKYKEVTEEEESHLKALYSQVLENEMIISKILNALYDNYKLLMSVPYFISLPRLELIKTRSVSKFWNQISIPILREKLEIRLTIDQSQTKRCDDGEKIWMDDKESMVLWNENFNNKTALFSSLGIKEVMILCCEDCSTIEIGVAEVKLFEDFFARYGNQILEITLRIEIYPGYKSHKNREKVFQSLFKECKSAKEFRFIQDCSESLANVEVSTSANSLLIASSEIASYKNLLKTFPNVAKICLGPGTDCLEGFFKFTANPKNMEFVKDALKNLKVLQTLDEEFPDDADLINNMKAFPVKIEEFIIGYLILKEEPTDLLTDVTSAFADSLKILKLAFNPPEEMLKAGLRFPKMEKLEKLEICLHSNNVAQWIFELGGFPNLKAINVKCNSMEDFECERQIFLECLLSEENKQHFPKLEMAFISYGQLQSKNYVYLDVE